MKNLALALLALTVVAQLATPAHMIRRQERILREGELFHFKTRPIDPADPFRGRYVALGFDAERIPSPEGGARPPLGSVVYATLATNAEGFVVFSGWKQEPPASGAYLKTRFRGEHFRWDERTRTSVHDGVRIDLPFNRFYMDEALAPEAEEVARSSTRSTNCWASVRVLGGRAAIEDVFASGRSLRALAAERRAR